MAASTETTVAGAVNALLRELAAAPDAAVAAAGLARVAHPRFLGKVGGERHLARLLGNSAYAPLVGHGDSRAEPAEVVGDAARVAFAVRNEGGTELPFLLSMVRHEGGGGGAGEGNGDGWRVTGLVRRELEHI